MQITEKEYQEFKRICDKQGIKYDTEEEYRESANNLIRFAELAYDMAKEEFYRKERLKDEPKGYTIIGEGRSCMLCHRGIAGDMWYDKWGQKCMDCQQAYNKKVIPGYVFKDQDNKRHISASTLNWKFNMPTPTINKLIRLGKLNPRIVKNEQYGDTVIFLKTENPNLPDVIEEELIELENRRVAKNKTKL